MEQSTAQENEQPALPPQDGTNEEVKAEPSLDGLDREEIKNAPSGPDEGSGAAIEQPDGVNAGLNGAHNIYNGSATPPNASPFPAAETMSHLPVTDSEISAAAQGASSLNRPRSAASVSSAAPSVSATPQAQETMQIPKPLPNPSSKMTSSTPQPTTSARLPQDRIGILEDRIAEDPRGDTDAWFELIEELKRRNKLPDVRKTYDRFLQVFPSAAEVWNAYAEMELEHNNFFEAEQIFSRAAADLPNVSIWTSYLNYVRRRYNLNNDPDGKHRKIVSEVFDYVLKNVGRDKDSGDLWMEYIQFLRSMPGNIGGTAWQDQQKKDTLRVGYHKAICAPHSNIGVMWSEYNKFEQTLDRAKSHTILQKHSTDYMQARGARHTLEGITRDLSRSTIAKLPPALGFDGDVEYMQQVAIWKQWVDWEKSDPLVIKPDQPGEWKARVIHVYKQALMALRFWPEMWYSAADFCFSNGLDAEGDKFLQLGTAANPESCLLAFQKADRVEATSIAESDSEENLKRRGDTVRKPYDEVINALYALIDQTQQRQARDITRLEEQHAKQAPQPSKLLSGRDDEDDDDAEDNQPPPANNAQLNAQIEAIKRGNAVQIELLKKTLSYAWIALMRAMRRVQGQGKHGEDELVRGFRGVFFDARKRGKVTSDVYSASALLEHHCYQDRVATKVFDRGFKAFPRDVEFALAYIKHLLEIQDQTNARAVFKTITSRLEGDPETVAKVKPLYMFWHDFESKYSELNLVKDLEKRMGELFPEDPKLALFSSRFSVPTFDPCAIRPVMSPRSQTKPKQLLPPADISMPAGARDSPRPTTAMAAAMAGNMGVGNSPKRSRDESEDETQPPKKMAKGESTLAGAAGRRLDAAKRAQTSSDVNGMGSTPVNVPLPPPVAATQHPLHPALYNFLRQLPPAHAARAQLSQVPAPAVVAELVQRADLSQFNHERLLGALAQGLAPPPNMAAAGWAPPPPPPPQYGYPPPQYGYR